MYVCAYMYESMPYIYFITFALSPFMCYPCMTYLYVPYHACQDMDDAYAFLTHCGLEIVAVGEEDDAADQGYTVVLSSTRDISEMLPVDKNGHPIPPTVSPMIEVLISCHHRHTLSCHTPYQHTLLTRHSLTSYPLIHYHNPL